MPGPNRLCRGALANWYLLSTDSLRDFPYLCSDNSYGEACNLISRRESHDWEEDATWPSNARATAPSRGVSVLLCAASPCTGQLRDHWLGCPGA